LARLIFLVNLLNNSRHEIPDGLKALALLGVFMVNGLGYALEPYYPLQIGAPMPIDSMLAQTIHAVAITLFMGKALPFLVFLFGYSMRHYWHYGHYATRFAQPTKFKRRQYKLLIIGVLHGTFIYFGDILTSYALLALWLGSSITLRGRALVKRWHWWLMLSVVLMVFKLFHEWKSYQAVLEQASDYELYVLTQVGSHSQFFSINATAYFGYMAGWLLSYYAPLHISLFITGILAARYRWLSLRPRMSTLFLRPWLYQSWPLALLANACLGLASVHLHSQYGLRANVGWIAVLNVPLGLWLVASSFARLMQHIQARQTIPSWLIWLAPAGRHTLAMYLGLSLFLVLCGRMGPFAAQADWNHTAVWFTALLLLWLCAVCLGREVTKRQMRDPISRWLSR
jgi:uncharacterized protein